jgi:glycosyltransferase involved in cell wall biosynthesis
MKTFWYVPIESLKARYTDQLCNEWIPRTFDFVSDTFSLYYTWQVADPPRVSEEITIGSVLDGVNRGVVSLQQMSWLLEQVHRMSDDDVIFLQDMWTPGLEALFYALHLRNLRPRIYAMCHAQSVDEYDFTYNMRSWMRPIEIAWSRQLAGLFVASTIHRDQLKAAGIECPIHVVGLPIHVTPVRNMMPMLDEDKQNTVIYSSRLNNEKNPYFMLQVAREFLKLHPSWEWVVTTSATQFSSEVPGLLSAMHELKRETEGRFRLLSGLTKHKYYEALCRAKIQFNCSLQDYVSWTYLEALAANCDVVYPDFRSFPECVDASRLYKAFNMQSAIDVLHKAIDSPMRWWGPLLKCTFGREIEMAIMLNNWQGPEVNIWHQPTQYFIGAELLHERT